MPGNLPARQFWIPAWNVGTEQIAIEHPQFGCSHLSEAAQMDRDPL
jgi:hypothetical protein